VYVKRVKHLLLCEIFNVEDPSSLCLRQKIGLKRGIEIDHDRENAMIMILKINV